MGYFYPDQLTIAYRRSRFTREMHIWVLEECKRSYRQDAQQQAAMIFVDVKVGTSSINATNARYVVELAVHVVRHAPLFSLPAYIEWQKSCKDKAESKPIPPLHLGKVLVIVGYCQQKRLIQQLLAQTPLDEVLADLIIALT